MRRKWGYCDSFTGASLRSFLKLDMAWPGIFFAMVCHHFNGAPREHSLRVRQKILRCRTEGLSQSSPWFDLSSEGVHLSINFEPTLNETLNHLNHLKPYLSVASRERLTGTGSKASNTGWSCSAAKKCKKTLKPSIWTLAKPWNVAWNARCAWSVASTVNPKQTLNKANCRPSRKKNEI
jgi:hypothetical protein